MAVAIAVAAQTPAPLSAAPPPSSDSPEDSPAKDVAPDRDGADAESVNLVEILRLALQKSPALAEAVIDIEVARAEVLQATGIEDWLARASGTYIRGNSVNVTRTPTGAIELTTTEREQYNLEGSVSRLLPTGGTVSLHGDGERLRLLGSGFEIYTTTVTAQLSHPLLRGRGTELTRSVGRRARLARNAVTLAREAAARDVIREIIGAYWEVVYARAALEIRISSLELAQRRLELTQKRVELGSAPRTAITEVEQVIAGRQEEILVAELELSERSLELRRLAGLKIGPHAIDLAPEETLGAEPRELELDSVLERALAESPELAALRARAKAAEIEVEVTENGLLPRLDFTVAGGPQGSRESAGAALGDMVSFEGYAVTANLTVEQPLGRREARGRAGIAAAERRRVRINRRDLEAQIATAAVRAVRLARSAGKRMEISERAIGLSKQNIDAEQRRFELGRATNFDVLERQEELKQARLRYARAAVDYLIADSFIESLTGSLLESYGISLKKLGGR